MSEELFNDGIEAEWGYISTKKQKENTEEAITASKGGRGRKSAMIEIPEKTLYRRAYGEVKMLELAGMEELKDGHSYHFITGGDIDSLSFLKFVMLRQPRLDYLLFSTWCMATADILQFREWVENGSIKRLDCYVGEIFPGSYALEWIMLNNLVNETGCGRVVSFKNHSKIYAGKGNKFAFVIESSANINTNPRTEQGVITLNEDLFNFYKNYFDGLK